MEENKKRLKIMFISAANCIHTIRWVNSLSDYFEVHLVYCKGHNVTINKPTEKVILHELRCRAPFGYYTNALQLRRLYNKIKPDIVNTHYASGYATLTRFAKIPMDLLSIWGSDVYDFPNESKIKKKILQKNVKYAKYIASTSNIMAEELKKQVSNLKKEIFITPFGVDVERFKKIEKCKNENNNIYIGNVKTLKEKYGISDAILAIKNLKDRLLKEGNIQIAEKIKMKIYGDGEDKEKLQKLIIDNKLEESVFLMGAIPNTEVPKALNELDIFCATSVLNSESFGVAVVEAMSCELPIVATNVDGFCEVMEDNVTGYIVERKNVENIAEALYEFVCMDVEKRKNIGKNGRKRVLEKYDWKKNVETMCEIYKKIAKEK